MLALPLAVIDLGPAGFSLVMGAGAVIGVFGHIIRSRGLILTGIVVIAAVSLLFLGQFLAHPSH